MRETQKGRRSWLERLTSPPEEEDDQQAAAPEPRSATTEPDGSDPRPEAPSRPAGPGPAPYHAGAGPRDLTPYQRPARPEDRPAANGRANGVQEPADPYAGRARSSAWRVEDTAPFALDEAPTSIVDRRGDLPTSPDAGARSDDGHAGPSGASTLPDEPAPYEPPWRRAVPPAPGDDREAVPSGTDRPADDGPDGTTATATAGDAAAVDATGAEATGTEAAGVEPVASATAEADSATPAWLSEGASTLPGHAGRSAALVRVHPDGPSRRTDTYPGSEEPWDSGSAAADGRSYGHALPAGIALPAAAARAELAPGNGASPAPTGPSVTSTADEVETVDHGPTEDERAEAARQQHADELQHRWLVTQAQLLDDPRDAVREAGLLINDALSHLTSTFSDHRDRIERSWKDDDGLTTDQLRDIMRRYRSLFQYVISVAKIPE